MEPQVQWQVAGNAAEVYEKELVPAIFAPWAPLVLGLADPQIGDRVLDVACGTGIVARRPRWPNWQSRRRRSQPWNAQGRPRRFVDGLPVQRPD